MKLQKNNGVYIKTKSGGRIAMNNLRPGDWMAHQDCVKIFQWLLLQNSAMMERIEIMSSTGRSFATPYRVIDADGMIYLGRGKKRWWYDRLPGWLRKHFMPYSKPE